MTLPAPVRSRSGAVVETIDGNRWRVYEWLRSGPPLAAPVSATITRAVGDMLATIHGLRVPVDGICPWSSVRFSPRELGGTGGRGRRQGRRLGAGAGRGGAHAGRAGAVGDGATPAEPVLCHNNLSPGNVRAGADGQLIVTGWEHANGLPPAWELSAALVNWAVNPGGGVNAAGARALVDGYRARAGSLPPLSLDGVPRRGDRAAELRGRPGRHGAERER